MEVQGTSNNQATFIHAGNKIFPNDNFANVYLREDKKVEQSKRKKMMLAIIWIGFMLFYCFQIAKMLSMKSWCNS